MEKRILCLFTFFVFVPFFVKSAEMPNKKRLNFKIDYSPKLRKIAEEAVSLSLVRGKISDKKFESKYAKLRVRQLKIFRKLMFDSGEDNLSKKYDGKTSCCVLNACNQDILHILVGVLHALPDLEEARFDGCRLQSLQPGIFTGLSKLRLLSFCNNNLKMFSSAIIAALFRLEVLDLRGNSISQKTIKSLKEKFPNVTIRS